MLGGTKSYPGHHLQLAGCGDPEFSDDAIAFIHQVSPRPAPSRPPSGSGPDAGTAVWTRDDPDVP